MELTVLRETMKNKPLTDRELEVLQKMADGKTNDEIGKALYLTINTVKSHASRVFAKLGAKDRANAVYISLKLGIIE